MPPIDSPPPPRFEDPSDFERFRGALVRADFTDRGILGKLDIANITRLKDIGGEVVIERTSDGSPLSTLIRLFLMGLVLPADDVRRAMEGVELDALVRSGLVDVREGSVHANFQILSFLGLYLAVDKPRRSRPDASDLPADYVMGVGGSTQTLANVTVRRPIEAMLDIGTGCGVHALLAAGHARRCVAVDINPRAIALTKFNAAVNGLTNVEARLGNMFEPVAGETFDLIVSNPPFVVSPENRFIYRDSALPRDGVVEMVVRQGAGHLRENGYLQMLCNWCNLEGQDTSERLGAWFTDSGCDAWVHQSALVEPDHYAMSWIGHTQGGDAAATRARMREWLEYYKQQGIAAIGMGMITMRRRMGRNWFKMDEFSERFAMLGPAGHHLERIFEGATLLQQTDETLLNARLRAAPDARIMHEMAPAGDHWSLVDTRIRLNEGLGFSATIDAYMARLIMGCDGRRPVRELIAEMASSLEMEEEKVRPSALKMVRGLVERGFVVGGERGGVLES